MKLNPMAKKAKLRVATLLLAGGMAVAAGTGCEQKHHDSNNAQLKSEQQHPDSDNALSKHEQEYLAKLKKEISQMSVNQLQTMIKECDIALARLKQVIDSKKTNPEEHFRARDIFNSISEERKLYLERLAQIKQEDE